MRDRDSGDRYRLAAAAVILLVSAALAIWSTGRAKHGGDTPESISLRHTQEIVGQTAASNGENDGGKDGTATTDAAGLTVTPADVLAMRRDFEDAYDADEAENTIREVFFVADHATDIVDDVAIRNKTETREPDFAALLKEGPDLTVEDAAAPTVLIFHTHTSESYALNGDGLFYPSQPTHRKQADRNMVRVGDELCAVLEQRGVGVIHDTAVYDDEYDGAYARSRETVLRYLEEFPTLKIAVDVHRDALKENGSHIKPTAIINGKKAAQIMIIAGAEENGVEYPHWETNLKFALSLQKTAQAKYMGLMKPVFFCPRRYNMDVTENSLLLEFGTEVNTLEEAVYSARLMGDVLADVVLAAEE